MSLKKFKQINYKKVTILFLIFLLGVVAGYLVLYPSYAYYEESKNFDVINGTVEDPGDIYFAYYIDGTISRNMPSQNTGYTLDTEKSNCNNGVIPTWDNAGWKFIGDYHSYNGADNTRTKCTLYFNKTAKTVSTVLGNIEVNSYIPDFTKSACDDESCESHEKGIYETTDYDGNPTYYYRGSVENNYVKFAGFYWRIIRINSNGSIRMIYDGTSAHNNGEASEDRQYGTSQFNTKGNDNMYLGYMYTEGQAHGTGTSSAIKTNVDKFYTDKLSSYTSKLDTNAGFCGDRSTLNLQANVGTGTMTTYYKAYLRVEENTPILTFENANDYYTMTNSSTGNKALTYPIGLISIDEAILGGHAGGVFNGAYNHLKKSVTNYLTTGTDFWTMSPVAYFYAFSTSDLGGRIFLIDTTGGIDDVWPYGYFGLRPVINIRSGVNITGSGTKTDPYVIN